MKSNFLVFAFLFFLLVPGAAQDAATDPIDDVSKEFTYGELKFGYGITRFSCGLKERFKNGNFSTSGGGLFSLAAYRKFRKINHLQFGLKFKALSAAPSEGDNNYQMFFNFWGVSYSTKYFPFSKSTLKGIFVQRDFNFVTQFTQKYRNSNALEFDHQFAIGRSFTLGIGYQFPLKNRYAMVVSVEYDKASRRGEVNGMGDMLFRNSNIGFQLGLNF